MIYSVFASKNHPKENTYFDSEINCRFINPGEIAFWGDCVVIADSDGTFGGPKSKKYISGVLECPTFGDLLKIAKAQQKKTRDLSHCFFEGIEDTGRDIYFENGPVRIIKLILGS